MGAPFGNKNASGPHKGSGGRGAKGRVFANPKRTGIRGSTLVKGTLSHSGGRSKSRSSSFNQGTKARSLAKGKSVAGQRVKNYGIQKTYKTTRNAIKNKYRGNTRYKGTNF